MGTSVFDQAWGNDPPPPRATPPHASSAFDDAWGADSSPTSGNIDFRTPPTTAPSRQAALPPIMRQAADGARVTPGKGDFAAMAPGIRGILTSAPQAIPGMEALQAGLRSLVRQQPYTEALSDMRHETDPVPLPIKIAAQLPAMLAMGRVPLSPAASGAVLGGASQALSADPTPLANRAVRTGVGAAAGGIIGKALDAGTTLVRAKIAPEPGKAVADMTGAMREADTQGYGAALREGEQTLQSRPSPIVDAALNSPDIKPFADQIRASRQFAGASDAQVLNETYKLMSRQQGGIVKRLAQNGYDAKLALEAQNISAAKDDLLNAADDIMPSYRDAVTQHRLNKSEIDAVGTGVDATRRVLGKSPSGLRLATQSKEAYAGKLAAMTPRNAAAARTGALGALGERVGLAPNIASLGGILPSLTRPAQVSTFLRSAGDSQQSLVDHLIRLGIISGSEAAR